MSDVKPENYKSWAKDLGDLEDQIATIQDMKKHVYVNIRATYGKQVADAMKSAMRLFRMDTDRRAEAEDVDARARAIVEILDKGDHSSTTGEEIISTDENFKIAQDPDTGKGAVADGRATAPAVVEAVGTQPAKVAPVVGKPRQTINYDDLVDDLVLNRAA